MRMGMAETYDGPIEEPAWLRIPHRTVRGNPGLSRRIISEIQQSVDVAYAEEWRFDHGIMVPLHFLDPGNSLTVIPANINCQGPPLTPLHAGLGIRRGAQARRRRRAGTHRGNRDGRHLALARNPGQRHDQRELGTGSSLIAGQRQDKGGMLSYTDEETYRDAGQGGFEIRTFIAAAAAAKGRGTVHFYAPIPIFAVGCTVATMEIA